MPLLAMLFVFAHVVIGPPRPIPVLRSTAPWPWPSPVPAKKSDTACDHPPRVTYAMAPPYANFARDLGLGPVITVVLVLVDEKGRTNAVISKSAGNVDIDRTAIRVAIDSTFEPAKRKCRSVSGTILFTVDFNPGF